MTCARLALTLALSVILSFCCVESRCADLIQPVGDCGTEGETIRYRSESRTEPRPLALHWLTIDLNSQKYELAVSMGNDPDGEGPIEAVLTPPRVLADRKQLVAAVNANAWKMLPSPTTGKRSGYVAGGCCDISGWARHSDATRSPPEKSHWSFWLDTDGHGCIGSIGKPIGAACSVAGFGGLLQDGKVLPQPSAIRHPRTALGLDQSNRWLTLLVVDGRREGYSEGVSLRELAKIMQRAGCWQALNLDGGGSSIMLVAEEPAKLSIVNRPADSRGPRPIPVMLGVRKR